MSEKEEKPKQPLKDVTGKELDDEALKDVAGGMRRVYACKPCDCSSESSAVKGCATD